MNPAPDTSQDHPTGLALRLARRIQRLGPISLAEYMAEVLTHPESGYYTRGDPLGEAGDFVTAPEISQMFGELIGLWCVETWQRLGAPGEFRLVELGPGRGTLIADALRAARVLPAFRRALRLHLVEINTTLRQRQEATLAQVLGQEDAPPRWHERLEEVPEGPFLLIANEFFDALPIRQLERAPKGWRERKVGLHAEEERLVFTLGPVNPALAALVPAPFADVPPGALIEISPAASALAAEIGRRLGAGGAAVIIDYGHSEPRLGATLQALKRHHRHHPLEDPGSADLTTHVDFATLAAAARAAGAEAHGPLAQGTWLTRLGIERRAEALSLAAKPELEQAVAGQLHRLVAPEEMGEIFKVLALTSAGLGPPAGFA